MKRLLTTCSLLLALLATSGAQAGHRDTLGSNPSGRHFSAPNVQRYTVNNREHRSTYNSSRKHSSRQHVDTRVNIIVGPSHPFGRPRYYDRRSYGGYSSFNGYNAGIGILGAGVVGIVSTSLNGHDHYDDRRHETRTVTRIIRDSSRTPGITLFRDRFGSCYERETNRYGTTVSTRVADYKCDF